MNKRESPSAASTTMGESEMQNAIKLLVSHLKAKPCSCAQSMNDPDWLCDRCSDLNRIWAIESHVGVSLTPGDESAKLLHSCPSCGEEWTNLGEMSDYDEQSKKRIQELENYLKGLK